MFNLIQVFRRLPIKCRYQSELDLWRGYSRMQLSIRVPDPKFCPATQWDIEQILKIYHDVLVRLLSGNLAYIIIKSLIAALTEMLIMWDEWLSNLSCCCCLEFPKKIFCKKTAKCLWEKSALWRASTSIVSLILCTLFSNKRTHECLKFNKIKVMIILFQNHFPLFHLIRRHLSSILFNIPIITRLLIQSM